MVAWFLGKSDTASSLPLATFANLREQTGEQKALFLRIEACAMSPVLLSAPSLGSGALKYISLKVDERHQSYLNTS